MEYLGYTVFGGKSPISTKKVEDVARKPVPTTHNRVHQRV
jgi:hypothetical protein